MAGCGCWDDVGGGLGVAVDTMYVGCGCLKRLNVWIEISVQQIGTFWSIIENIADSIPV